MKSLLDTVEHFLVNNGNKNAAVLPEPVCAHTIKSDASFLSLKPIAAGIECFCTGVGFTYPHNLIFLAKYGGI